MCVIFRKLFILITILIYLEIIFVSTAIDKDFRRTNHLEKGEDLISDWKWVSKPKGGLLGNSPVAAALMKSLSFASAIFTIWIFAETREKPADNRQITSEQVESLNDRMEYLNIQMEDVQHSLMQLTCLIDTVHAHTKKKPVSRECLQFIQKHKQAETYAPILTKPSHFITNNHIENTNSLSTSLRLSRFKN